nr:TRAP transporter TatT component family protein [Bacteriovorax sp. HI3]
MNKLRLAVTAITLGTLLSSCSTFNKMAVGGASDLIYTSGNGVLHESNFDVFKDGLPGNLILIEGLLAQSPKNMDLLATLNKGYAGYAFAVNETHMYEEEWAELKSEEGKKQALFNYTRSLNFGLRYLKEKGIELNDIISRMNEPQGIHLLLDKKMGDDKRDLETVLFTAQSLAALVNIQKDNMGLVSQLPAAKGMFDWVCLKDPSINYGTCDIFYGAYEAGRPQMLGGNPAKGKEIFLKAITKHPHNWLIRTSYMQFYLIPQNDEEGFKEQMLAMKGFHDEFQKYYIYDQNPKSESAWTRESGMRFYQTLSLKRYELMNRFQKQFF